MLRGRPPTIKARAEGLALGIAQLGEMVVLLSERIAAMSPKVVGLGVTIARLTLRPVVLPDMVEVLGETTRPLGLGVTIPGERIEVFRPMVTGLRLTIAVKEATIVGRPQ